MFAEAIEAILVDHRYVTGVDISLLVDALDHDMRGGAEFVRLFVEREMRRRPARIVRRARMKIVAAIAERGPAVRHSGNGPDDRQSGCRGSRRRR